MTDEEIKMTKLNFREIALESALRTIRDLGNSRSSSNQIGGQASPVTYTSVHVLAEADKIYEWLIKDL